jgi:hypothetical protein
VVYVVDRSISMGPSGAWTMARQEIAASLGRLPTHTLFQVIAYNRRAEPLEIAGQRGLVAVSPAAIESANSQLAEIEPAGATDHVRALHRALVLRPEVLYLITDADDLESVALAALLRLNKGRTACHVIQVSAGHASGSDGPLARLAALTGGSYRRMAPER